MSIVETPQPQPPPAGAPVPRLGERRDRLRAIALICLAVACFSFLDATAKVLIGPLGLPMAQVVWVRFVGQVAFVVLAVGLVSVPSLMVSRRVSLQILRSFLLLGSTAFNFFALRELRLDQTTTIMFLAPLIVALLAGPALGEWVGWRRLAAILVGFGGILVVVRPGAVPISTGMLYAFAAVSSYAVFILVTRYLAAYDPPQVTLFFSLFAGTVVVAPFGIASWVWPSDVLSYVLLAALGFWGGVGHYLFILAHRLAPAPTIAPFLYTQLVTMTGLGYLVFGDVPDGWSLVGAGIVIASGIYLITREAKVRGTG
jgi:drug/metabolite transporter (DMT)-like permease